MLTADDLDRLERLAKAATPGPWHVHQPHSNSLPHIRTEDGVYIMDAPSRNGLARARTRQVADGRHIAACHPQTILALVEMARQCEAQRAEAEAAEARIARIAAEQATQKREAS